MALSWVATGPSGARGAVPFTSGAVASAGPRGIEREAGGGIARPDWSRRTGVVSLLALMPFDAARVGEHIHGHLGWLAAVALAHPAILLRQLGRRAHRLTYAASQFRCDDVGIGDALRKAAHWAFVAAALPALTTALPGTLVASYWTF